MKIHKNETRKGNKTIKEQLAKVEENQQTIEHRLEQIETSLTDMGHDIRELYTTSQPTVIQGGTDREIGDVESLDVLLTHVQNRIALLNTRIRGILQRLGQ